MASTPAPIMQDDSLAARLFAGHDYKGSLVNDSLAGPDPIREMAMQQIDPVDNSFMQGIHDFFASLPWPVYAIIGVCLVGCLAWWAIRNGMLGIGFGSSKAVGEEGDDIYDIDFDEERETALHNGDYAALVRLVYLRTLRMLDEQGRITWRIYKTPLEYDDELHLPPFTTMTAHFLRVRYGKFGASRALYDEMCALQEAVEKGGEA